MTTSSKAKSLVREARELLSKATPGPWEARTGYVYHLNARDRAARIKSYPICGVSLPGANEMLAATGSYGNTEQAVSIRNANATLIARAPDLLSSLCNELDTQVSLNEVQAQNIVEFQREQKMFRDALREAKEVIKTWHGPDAWDIYDQHSPEMIRINAVLEAATKES